MELPDKRREFKLDDLVLEPMSFSGLEKLAPKLRVPEVFSGGHGGGLAALPDTDQEYVNFFAQYCPWQKGGRSYLVRYQGEMVGTTSLYELVKAKESVAIGYTAYAPAVWGTGINPMSKFLLLNWAFSEANLGRVLFYVDHLNQRSQNAVLKLGAKLDGRLRRDAQRADGSWRDTCVYSILKDEWPLVKKQLLHRIGENNRSS